MKEIEAGNVQINEPHDQVGMWVGLSIWILWVAGVSILLSSLNSGGRIDDYINSPLINWIQIGPMLIFIFTGRKIMRKKRQKEGGHDPRGTGSSDLLASSVTFFAWATIIIVCSSIGMEMIMMTNVAGGLAFSYFAMSAYNRKWVT